MSLPAYIAAGKYKIPLEVRRSPSSRRITLRFNPQTDAMLLTMPAYCRPHQVVEFLESRKDWIRRHISTLPPRIPLQFGTVIEVLGKELEIFPAQVRSRRKNLLPVLASPGRCEAIVQEMLATMLLKYIEPKAKRYAKKISKEVESIVIRDPHSRWGSCTHDGKLMFSWRLVFAPKHVIDYLVAHEVAHLRYHNHGPRFWQTVEEILPRYKAGRDWLKQNGLLLQRYGRKL